MGKKRNNIFVLTWQLLVKTTPAWNRIASVKESVSDMRKYFVFPWMVICVIISGVFGSLYAKSHPIESGVLRAIVTFVSLFGAYYLSKTIACWYLQKKHTEKYADHACEKVIGYSFAVVYLLHTVVAVLPELFYLQILSIYTAYLLWEATRIVMNLNEDERGNVVLVFTVLIVFLPKVIVKILYLLLPNV